MERERCNAMDKVLSHGGLLCSITAAESVGSNLHHVNHCACCKFSIPFGGPLVALDCDHAAALCPGTPFFLFHVCVLLSLVLYSSPCHLLVSLRLSLCAILELFSYFSLPR